jgi:hypothetical protein
MDRLPLIGGAFSFVTLLANAKGITNNKSFGWCIVLLNAKNEAEDEFVKHPNPRNR